jgi:hypothetical protein
MQVLMMKILTKRVLLVLLMIHEVMAMVVADVE